MTTGAASANPPRRRRRRRSRSPAVPAHMALVRRLAAGERPFTWDVYHSIWHRAVAKGLARVDPDTCVLHPTDEPGP